MTDATTIPTASTSTGRSASTSRSGTGSTSAWVRHSRDSKAASRSRSCSTAFPNGTSTSTARDRTHLDGPRVRDAPGDRPLTRPTMEADIILVDEPAPMVSRITMNRPEKRNALDHPLRGAILGHAAPRTTADRDVRVTIIRGAGPSFSAGYDLGGGNVGLELPYYTPGGEGHWPRHVTEGWMSIWDLAKPVIAQVHGYCLAGGSELATGCDLVYIAEDAQMGYPAVRFGVPDMHFHAWLLGMRRGDGDDADRRLDLGRRSRRRRVGQPSVPGRRARRRGDRRRAANREAGTGAGADEQASGPPADGRHGDACRAARRHRALRSRDPHRRDARVFLGASRRRGSPTR